jgi:hypothetical protein
MQIGVAQFLRVACLAGAVMVGAGLPSALTARAAVMPVFRYSFPDSSSDIVSNAAVTDRSPAGNHGTVSGDGLSGTGLSNNVPAGMTGQSVDFTATGTHAIRTNATQLLNTPAVANAGGFSYDVWVFPTALPTGTGLFKIIDYAGTETLSITSAGVIRATLNSASGTALNTTTPLTLNQWHHLTMIFDTKGNPAEPDPGRATFSQVNGEISLLVDGVASGPLAHLRNGFGDMLNRPTSIGGHPTSTGERFLGLIYNPTVSLGVVPEPASLGLLGLGALGLLARRRQRRGA